MLVRRATTQDAAGIAKVHVDSWRTSYQGIVPDSVLQRLSYEGREATWVDIVSNHLDNAVFVAVSEDHHIVGFASGGKERSGDPTYTGELYAIYLLKEHQGRGFGQALTQAVVHSLRENGVDSMLLWVLKDNSACGFYEYFGGRKVGEKIVSMDGIPLIEYAYGWDDLSRWG